MTTEQTLAEEISEGLAEAIKFAKGEHVEGCVTYMFNDQEICPRDIRQSLHLTRERFHEWFVCKVSNQRNWETGLRKPSEVTLAFYSMIKENPSQVYKMLHHSTIPKNG
ncbi:MAG: hypothetical protein COA94_02575 [Rickettsiales bacterium]|nr:MAG: hypothetical protein COA94_02575 [Rickettsiales bacterium]